MRSRRKKVLPCLSLGVLPATLRARTPRRRCWLDLAPPARGLFAASAGARLLDCGSRAKGSKRGKRRARCRSARCSPLPLRAPSWFFGASPPTARRDARRAVSRSGRAHPAGCVARRQGRWIPRRGVESFAASEEPPLQLEPHGEHRGHSPLARNHPPSDPGASRARRSRAPWARTKPREPSASRCGATRSSRRLDCLASRAFSSSARARRDAERSGGGVGVSGERGGRWREEERRERRGEGRGPLPLAPFREGQRRRRAALLWAVWSVASGVGNAFGERGFLRPLRPLARRVSHSFSFPRCCFRPSPRLAVFFLFLFFSRPLSFSPPFPCVVHPCLPFVCVRPVP